MADAEIEVVRAQLAARPRPVGWEERRARMDAFGALYAMPAGVSVAPVNANGVAAEWTSAPDADKSRVLIFFHGGGYCSGSIASHRHMVAELGRLAGCRTLAVGYRLAPEYPFPAALEDALTAYRFVRGQGVVADRIALCGESAGGGLALAALVSLRDVSEALPGRAWLSSPWADLSQSGATIQSKADTDPLIQKAYLDELAAAYVQGADAANPLISPIHADLTGLPPMLIQVGSAETLLDDSVRIAAAAGGAGVRVTLDIWPDMIHAFTLFYQQVVAGERALAEAAVFMRGHAAGA